MEAVQNKTSSKMFLTYLVVITSYKKLRHSLLKFKYSEKATKFCEIFTLLLTVCTVVKSNVKISHNFVAFSEYLNFISNE